MLTRGYAAKGYGRTRRFPAQLPRICGVVHVSTAAREQAHRTHADCEDPRNKQVNRPAFRFGVIIAAVQESTR